MVEQMYTDIDADVERTFTDLDYFQKDSTKNSLKRILIALTNYEQSVGYVQGMNYIAGVLLFHAGEVGAFWLMCSLIDKYNLKNVLQQGFPALAVHNQEIQKRLNHELPQLSKHFELNQIPISLLTTDWIICLFMNCLPLDLTSNFLTSFFKNGWISFYNLAISIFRYHQKKLLSLDDSSEIISTVKQIWHGCCTNNFILDSATSLSLNDQGYSVTMSDMDESSSEVAESVITTQVRNHRQGATTACYQFSQKKIPDQTNISPSNFSPKNCDNVVKANAQAQNLSPNIKKIIKEQNSPENFTDGSEEEVFGLASSFPHNFDNIPTDVNSSQIPSILPSVALSSVHMKYLQAENEGKIDINNSANSQALCFNAQKTNQGIFVQNINNQCFRNSNKSECLKQQTNANNQIKQTSI